MNGTGDKESVKHSSVGTPRLSGAHATAPIVCHREQLFGLWLSTLSGRGGWLERCGKIHGSCTFKSPFLVAKKTFCIFVGISGGNPLFERFLPYRYVGTNVTRNDMLTG